MTAAKEIRSIGDLLGNAVSQLGKLIGNEIQLARAELSQKLSQGAEGVAFLLGALVAFIPALVMLSIGIALFLVQRGLSAPTAYLAVAGVDGLIAVALAVAGMNRLKIEKLKPTITMQQLERDLDAVKESAR